MTTLMQANRQWASRPADQRFTSLDTMATMMHSVRDRSTANVVSNRALRFAPSPADEKRGLVVQGGAGTYDVTHWAFGQLAALAAAPAGYLRTLPAPIAADALNYGMRFARDVGEVQILREMYDDGADSLTKASITAATGPRYGRIWNADVIDAVRDKVGDGVSGRFRVPGEFGKAIEVTKANTTLFASDRDMFVFLADETNRIELPNRRAGKSGSLAKGFFLWNSEVGAQTFGLGVFLFDYVCCNRIVWGAEGYKEIRIRHTAGAPDRWVEQALPQLAAYADEAAGPLEDKLIEAQHKRVDDDLTAFLSSRFTKAEVAGLQEAHLQDEGRPIESLWDVVTGATAFARGIPNNDSRVDLERRAGALLDLVD